MNPFQLFKGLAICALLFQSKTMADAPSWSQSSAPGYSWYGLASSADGNNLFATCGIGPIYTSTNGGFDWISNSVPGKLGHLSRNVCGWDNAHPCDCGRQCARFDKLRE